MSNSKKGLKIGHYRITPLGLGVFAALIVLVLALVAALIFDPFGGKTDVQKGAQVSAPSASPTADPAAEPTADPTPSPTPAPTPTPAPRSATIRSLGEIAIENDLLKSAYNADDSTFDFSPMFSDVAAVIGNADYTVADVEGTLGDTTGVSGQGGKMNTPSALLSALKDCGVDMMMLANDHALDGGFAELQASIANVTAAGMDYVGAATSAEERATPVVKDINGIQVGFVAYTETVNGNEKNTDAAAVEYGVNLVSHSNAVTDIQNARAAGAEVIVAYVSWGNMLERTPTQNQYKLAQALTAAGADVIIGYNPHVVQPAYWIEADALDGSGKNRTLCLCATGNMLSNQRAQYADSGIIFEFTIQEQADGTFEIVNPVYIPTYVWRYQTEDSELYQYRVMPVGQWIGETEENIPEGMPYSDYQRMAAVWAEVQSTMGSDVATIGRE